MTRNLAFVSLLFLAACAYPGDQGTNRPDTSRSGTPPVGAENAAFDGRDTSFELGGKRITLVNGLSETAIENSAAKISTRYIDTEATGDLNDDGQEDHAFFVAQTTGGSGTFYYVVAALKHGNGYETTNAFFIGDRIVPQLIEIHSSTGTLRVRYADRKPGTPMTQRPTEERVLSLRVAPNGTLAPSGKQ